MHPTHNIKARAREIIYKFFQDSDEYFHKGSIKIAIEGWFDIKNLETAIDTIIDLATQAETIICSAIKTDDGEIVRGHRHCHCFATANDIPRLQGRKDWEQGFMTSKNRFVGRKEAYDLFVRSGAVSVDEAVHPMQDRNELYSEDLY
jgi:hypothetical protein